MHSEITEQPLVPNEVHLALTSGLAPGAKLRENHIFTLSATGVEFKGEPTLAQWMEGMRMLSWMKTAFTLWLADFIECGRKRSRERRWMKRSCSSLQLARELGINLDDAN